jgi:hypothetical protein
MKNITDDKGRELTDRDQKILLKALQAFRSDVRGPQEHELPYLPDCRVVRRGPNTYAVLAYNPRILAVFDVDVFSNALTLLEEKDWPIGL